MIYAQYFSSEEFREWAEDMSPRLVTMLDVLRFRLGSPIAISGSDYALGRNLGRGKMSAHNIDEWGEVLAVDCFIGGVYSRAQAEAVAREAVTASDAGDSTQWILADNTQATVTHEELKEALLLSGEATIKIWMA